MKTNYTMQSRGITCDADLEIIATFKGGLCFRGVLGDLIEWAAKNEADCPLSCLINGNRHGLFPIIIAEDENVARALTHLTGALITKDDGATFATRTQLRAVASSMARAGIRPSRLAFQWGVTELPYERAPQQRPASFQKPMSYEEQLADSPFA